MSSRRRELAGARGLYRAFREEEPDPRRARKIAFKVTRAAATMGPVEFIGYVTTHRGEPALYIHEFAPGSRPMLAAGPGRGELYLVGGRYKVTGRGITDLDAAGRIVHARRRYTVKLRRR